MEHSWFKDWFNSPYYHLLYAYRDEKEASEFIKKLLTKINPARNATMLDVACGKGRHSLQLADLGYDVTGIDLSKESILEAKKFERDNLHFYVHDMRLPFRINYYDFVFNFFTSFGYFDSQREHDNALRTIASALKPGGTFVIDYLNAEEPQENSSEEKILNGIKYTILKTSDEKHFYKKIIVDDPALNHPLEFSEQVAKFTLPDFMEMLTKQGLEINRMYGDYNFHLFAPRDAGRLILFAQKPGG